MPPFLVAVKPEHINLVSHYLKGDAQHAKWSKIMTRIGEVVVSYAALISTPEVSD